MKIALDKKIVIGFIINLLIVFASGILFIYRNSKPQKTEILLVLNWIEPILFLVSIALLFIVFFIIKSQMRTKNKSIDALLENKQLLQSIINNTSNPIFIKKINGEYLLINKQFEVLFGITNQDVLGKSDYDFMSKKAADAYANSDFEVLKVLRELKSEETIEQADGTHTYIAVKFPLYDIKGRIYALCGIFTDISDRKKNEQSLVAADKFFNMSLDILAIVSKDVFIKVNPATVTTFGYTEQELLSQSFYAFMYPEDYEISRKEIEKLQRGVLTQNFENRFICKNGNIKTIIWSVFPELSSGFLYAVGRDITEKKESEKTLMAAENFFNISFDMFVIIKDDKFIKINPAFSKTLGYNQDDANRIKFIEIIHPDDKKQTQEIIANHLEGKPIINFRARFLCKDGAYKWLDLNSNIDAPNQIFYSVGRDVTKIVELENEQKRVLNELYENEQKLRLVVENISEGIIVINVNKKIILANNMANEIFGVENDEAITINLNDYFEIFYPDANTIFPSQKLPFETAIKGEITTDLEVILLSLNTAIRSRVLISGKPLINQNQIVVAAVITIKDISRYKQMEEDLKETELKYRKLIGYTKSNGKKK